MKSKFIESTYLVSTTIAVPTSSPLWFSRYNCSISRHERNSKFKYFCPFCSYSKIGSNDINISIQGLPYHSIPRTLIQSTFRKQTYYIITQRG